MAKTVYVVVENYRDEKTGDSSETVKVLAVHDTVEKAINIVKENFEKTIEIAEEMFGKDRLSVDEPSEYGAQIYLEYEWDTFHADYTISKMVI